MHFEVGHKMPSVGGSLLGLAPVFTADGRHCICAAGNGVRLVSVASGNTTRTLEGHTAQVTGCVLDPTNSEQLFTGSRDHTIRLWNSNDGRLLQVFDAGRPVLQLVATFGYDNCPIVTYAVERKRKRREDGGAGGSGGGAEDEHTEGQPDDEEVDEQDEENAAAAAAAAAASGGSAGAARSMHAPAVVQVYQATFSGKSGKTNNAAPSVRSLFRIAMKKGLPCLPGGGYGVPCRWLVAAPSYSPRQQDAVALFYKKSLYLWSPRNPGYRVHHTHIKAIVSVAMHPSLQSVAVGDSQGKIILLTQPLVRLTDHSTGGGAAGGGKKQVAGGANAAGSAGGVTTVSLKSGGSSSATVERMEIAGQTGMSAMHWHSHAVFSLTYTSDGAYLLSGGEEGVMVVWQLKTGATNFLSRLGAPVLSLATGAASGGECYALLMGDNSVRVVDAVTWNGRLRLQGLKCRSTQSLMRSTKTHHPIYSGIQNDPVTGGVMLNGLPGTLQIYDPRGAGSHVAEVDVSMTNYLSRSQGHFAAVSRVELAALSPNGDTLVTVDRRADGTHSDMSSLKFFYRQQQQQQREGQSSLQSVQPGQPQSSGKVAAPGSAAVAAATSLAAATESTGGFALHMLVQQPHALGSKVVACAFHPTQPWVVTAARDGTFKLWCETKKHSTSGTAQARKAPRRVGSAALPPPDKSTAAVVDTIQSVWSCAAQGSYRSDLVLTDASFSPDGSMLCVSYGEMATLWSLGGGAAGGNGAAMKPVAGGEDGDDEEENTPELNMEDVLAHPPLQRSIRKVSFSHGAATLVTITSVLPAGFGNNAATTAAAAAKVAATTAAAAAAAAEEDGSTVSAGAVAAAKAAAASFSFPCTLYVWDLMSTSILWSTNFTPGPSSAPGSPMFASHPTLPFFAVCAQSPATTTTSEGGATASASAGKGTETVGQDYVLLFDASAASSAPVAAWQRPASVSGGPLQGLLFANTAAASSGGSGGAAVPELLCLTSDHTFTTLGGGSTAAGGEDGKDASAEASAAAAALAADDTPASAFLSLFPGAVDDPRDVANGALKKRKRKLKRANAAASGVAAADDDEEGDSQEDEGIDGAAATGRRAKAAASKKRKAAAHSKEAAASLANHTFFNAPSHTMAAPSSMFEAMAASYLDKSAPATGSDDAAVATDGSAAGGGGYYDMEEQDNSPSGGASGGDAAVPANDEADDFSGAAAGGKADYSAFGSFFSGMMGGAPQAAPMKVAAPALAPAAVAAKPKVSLKGAGVAVIAAAQGVGAKRSSGRKR